MTKRKAASDNLATDLLGLYAASEKASVLTAKDISPEDLAQLAEVSEVSEATVIAGINSMPEKERTRFISSVKRMIEVAAQRKLERAVGFTPVKETRTVPLAFRVTPTMKAALDRYATDNRRSVSSLVEGLIEDELTKRGYLKA